MPLPGDQAPPGNGPPQVRAERPPATEGPSTEEVDVCPKPTDEEGPWFDSFRVVVNRANIVLLWRWSFQLASRNPFAQPRRSPLDCYRSSRTTKKPQDCRNPDSTTNTNNTLVPFSIASVIGSLYLIAPAHGNLDHGKVGPQESWAAENGEKSQRKCFRHLPSTLRRAPTLFDDGDPRL